MGGNQRTRGMMDTFADTSNKLFRRSLYWYCDKLTSCFNTMVLYEHVCHVDVIGSMKSGWLLYTLNRRILFDTFVGV